MAGGKHPVPSRTRKLSLPAPMVLGRNARESRSPPGFLFCLLPILLSPKKACYPALGDGRFPVGAARRLTLPEKGTLSLIRDPRICFYWGGQFLSTIGSNIWGIALPLLAIRETGSSLSVALTLLVTSVPELVIGPWAGALADRYSKRTTVIALDGARALLYFIAMLAVSRINGWSALSLLLVVAFVEALVRMWYIGAKSGLLKAFGSEGYGLQKLNALDRGLQNAARIIGLIVGGFVVAEFGTVTALLANSLSFALAAIASGVARLPIGASSQRQSETRWQFAIEGFRYLKSAPAARDLVIRQAILNLLIPAYAFGLPILAYEFWRNAEYLGFAFGAFAGGGLIASVVLGRRRSPRVQAPHIWGAIAAAGGLTVAVAGMPPAIGIVLVGVVGLISHAAAITLNARLLEIVDGTHIGRVSVLSAVANRISSGLVILVLGVATSPAKIRQAMGGVGMSIGVLSLIALIKSRNPPSALTRSAW